MKNNESTTNSKYKLTPFAENLRVYLFNQNINRDEWVEKVSKWVECSEERSEKLLTGEEPKPEEVEALKKQLRYFHYNWFENRLLSRGDILYRNIVFLINSLPYGEKGVLAKSIGVSSVTISRWLSGKQKPTPENIEALHIFFNLEKDANLIQMPIFLSYKPIGNLKQIQNSPHSGKPDFQSDAMIEQEEEKIFRKNLNYIFDILARGKQRELARFLGVHESTITNWKSGIQKPSKDQCDRILYHLKLDEDIDLRKDLLVLPILPSEQREWVMKKVQQLEDKEISKVFPRLVQALVGI